MAKYRKKPVVVDAIQFYEDWYFMDRDKYYNYGLCDRANLSELWFNQGAIDGRFYISTLEGHMIVSNGDYIIKGIKGEFYPCKSDIFVATYEKVED